MHDKRRQEVCEDLIMTVKQLDNNKVIAAICLLKELKRFVRGPDGRQLRISIQLTNSANDEAFKAKALIDSRAMRSCVSQEFVDQHQIPTRPTAIPVLVYNADGSLNVKGSIRSFATL